MTRNENTQIVLKYTYEDLLKWIQQDASNVLNLAPHEITDCMVEITPDNVKQLDIKVTHVKIIGKTI